MTNSKTTPTPASTSPSAPSITAVGTLNYAHLTKVDAEYNCYSVSLTLDPVEGGILAAEIDAVLDAHITTAKTAAKGKAIKTNSAPYTENPDGSYTFKFKQRAVILVGEAKEPKAMTIKVYDAKKAIITEQVPMANTTEGKVAYKIVPYVKPSFGVQLRLVACQITKLVPYVSADNVEDGFTATGEDVSDDIPF